jgi:Sortase domain
MQNELSLTKKVRFVFNVFGLYLVTAVIAWAALHPGPRVQIRYAAYKAVPVAPTVKVIAGIPVRIVIPGSSYQGQVVDLPVDKGYYDPASGWMLSGYHAQYMTISSPANNFSGQTFIYGHNNDYVFGALRHVTPSPGAQALIYSDNGHVFSYSFVSSTDVAPDATAVLDYHGPPILTIQTCTGSFNEVRTLYYFKFDRLVQ